MKNLLFIVLCLLCITGCNDEVPKQEQPNIKQEEKVEENKYITIKLDINKDCNTEVKDSCKVTNFTIENDKDNIFRDLDLDDSYYCDLYGNDCKEDIRNTSTLNKIYEIAVQHNMNLIPDFRYLVNDDYKKTREIIIKPLEDLKWEGKINLNENVLVKLSTTNYNEFESYCMIDDKDYGKQYVMSRCGIDQGGIKKKINDSLIEQINSTPGRVYKGKFIDDLGYEEVIISDITLFGNPRLYKENNYNLLKRYLNEHGVYGGYKTLYNEYTNKIGFNTLNISRGMDINYKVTSEYKILDEQTCEEYNLVCDRW